MKNIIFIILLFLLKQSASAQKDSSAINQQPVLTLTTYLDCYYFYDVNQPSGSVRQPYFYNHNRHNEFNINQGVVKLGVSANNYRANLALHAGTYAQDNYSAEQGMLRNIFEANAGLALNKNKNLWLDAGIFASHIGFESALAFDCWNLSRSILAENSPYYLSGAKLSFQPDSSWEISGLICNGWQRIKRLDGNSLPGFGTQINKKLNDTWRINWSTYIGSEFPDSIRRMRYFNNIYTQVEAGKFGLIAGFDIGIQQFNKGSSDYDLWYSPVLIGRWKFNDHLSTSLRVEYYSDPEQVIVSVPSFTHKSFEVFGASLNLDYQHNSYLLLRIEGRALSGSDEVFLAKDELVTTNFFIGTSLAFKLDRVLN